MVIVGVSIDLTTHADVRHVSEMLSLLFSPRCLVASSSGDLVLNIKPAPMPAGPP